MKMILNRVLVTFLVTLVVQLDAYKILSIYPFEGRSHFIMLRAINMALVKAGHQVDVISHYPLEKSVKNYRDIVDLSGSRLLLTGNMTVDIALSLSHDPVHNVAHNYGNDVCDLIGHEKMKHFMENLSKMGPYDAVITEAFGSDCYFAFGHYFNAPVIVVSTMILPPWIDYITRNPPSLAYMTHCLFQGADTYDYHNFWARWKNTYSYFKSLYNFFKITEYQNEVIQKYFGSGIPDLRTLQSNIALTLVNSHYSIFGIRPLLPSVIEIAGIHVLEDDVVMSSELQKWMNDSTDGVVFFSLGSMVNFESLPKEMIQTFFKSFSKIAPVKVLIKVTSPELVTEKIPNNVKMLSWIPQIPVLRHNNTKVFITHGGVMGTLEAIYYEVPMIGIPLFGDQPKNVYMWASKNLLLALPYNKISENTLDSKLNAILCDSKYKSAIQKTSRNFRDRPLNASKAAVYWIEYVIRNGASSLQSPGIQLYWWQNDLLDVYLFTLTVIIIVLYLCQRVLKISLRTTKQQNKKKFQ